MNHEHLLGRLREEAGPKVTEDPAEEDEEEEEEANGEEEKEDTTNTPSQLTEVVQRAGRGGGNGAAELGTRQHGCRDNETREYLTKK